MALLTKKFSIEAAHFLPNYPGKCSRMHGHRWEIKLTVKGSINAETGMVVDFSTLKKLLINNLEECFDHYVLNNISPFTSVLYPPTAENIAKFIFQYAQEVLGTITVYSVEVAETEDNIATVFAEDMV